MDTNALALVPPVEMIGHNNPPEPTPFELSRDEIDGLFMEAKNWCDGEAVQTQAQADAVAKLQDAIRAAINRADDRRKAENEPFDRGKAEVQARYAPLIADTKAVRGKAVLGLEACKDALKPFLIAQEKKRLEAAELARKEAARKEEEARAAIAQAQSLEAKENAETLVREAREADKAATKIETVKASAKGGKRATSLHTYYESEVTDATAFARFVWTEHKADMLAMLDSLAAKYVAAGRRSVPGVTVHERQRVQ